MELTYAAISSPVGTWAVEGTTLGVTKVFLPHETAPAASAIPATAVATAARQLDEYFHGARRDFDVTLADATATQFQYDVWRVLQSLPFGSVATYAEVAGLAGRPRAARAVGNANHANPWPVIVPCHRVVASLGLGGYGGGEDVKRYLLSLEGVNIA